MDELMFVPSANNVMFMQIKPAISQLLISTMIFLRVSVIIVCTVVIDRCMLLVSLVVAASTRVRVLLAAQVIILLS
jgi:hypothetical protein